MSSSNPWIYVPRPVANPRLRLFCFPYAGGAATMYQHWPETIGADVELCALALPGRAFRFREAAFTDLGALVEETRRQIHHLLDAPYALYGHSMGALVAFEVSRAQARSRARLPERLIVSGRRAPHLHGNGTVLHRLPEPAFVAALRTFYGTPELLLRSAELRELVLPALRADLQAVETWKYVPAPPLPIPISAIGGLADEGVSPGDIEAWEAQTTASFDAHFLAAGHFFVHSHQQELCALLSRTLSLQS